MTETTNYNLQKPDGTDNAKISIINGNMDILDEAVKENADDIANAEAVVADHELDTDNPHSVSPPQLGGGYGTCDTAAATAAKTVSISNFTLVTGGMVAVKFTYGNTNTASTLNINNTGAKQIWFGSARLDGATISAGDTVQMIYDGTYYRVIAVDSLASAIPELAQIEKGTYTGTGTSTRSITFPFVPKLVIVAPTIYGLYPQYGDSRQGRNGIIWTYGITQSIKINDSLGTGNTNSGTATVTLSSKTLTISGSEAGIYALNNSGTSYTYVAFG